MPRGAGLPTTRASGILPFGASRAPPCPRKGLRPSERSTRGTTHCLDELSSARGSGHRAHRLTSARRQRKELIVSGPHPPLRTLREHPDLDQLRRQAKELLAAFRAGDPDAVTAVRHYYHGADPAT